jgi:cytochrome c-type biogenesis protein CcsB
MLAVTVGFASIVVLSIAAMALRREATRPAAPEPSAFAQQVDLAPLGRVAVYDEGRLKSFDSFASSMMQFVSGPHPVAGNSSPFAYLDLMLRPEAYADADVIYVKNKPLRGEIAAALRASLDETLPAQLAALPGAASLIGSPAAAHEAEVRRAFDQRIRGFLRTGLVSQQMLLDTRVQQLLDAKESDLIRTAKAVQQVRTAMNVAHPEVLERSLKVMPPPGGGFDDPWLTLEEASVRGGAPAALAEAWGALRSSWAAQDAPGASSAAAKLAPLLAAVSPGLYPDQRKLGWESWYFHTGNMTWVWLIYLLSVVFLLMSVVYRWPAARWAGLGVFGAAFALHTFALVLRWYVSGRWPNANMFEAVTTSVWFGGAFALVMEVLARRSPMRNLFVLGSAVASMVALMCAHFMPLGLNPNISNKMPVLHDVWLYIHTNVVIFSYCLISMAAVTALGYVLYRLGGGAAEYVRVGGAGALIMGRPGMNAAWQPSARGSAGQVLDGATMILMELSFIMLWAGLVMGAIWADHSWGRPWGWDPKEVFALNTFIVLALLIHVRMKVRDKGLWTALLALGGFVVMMFNWYYINFIIVGLHSYA